MDETPRKVRFLWRIERFNLCSQVTNEALKSPNFCIPTLGNTLWCFVLYPRGEHTDQEYISCYLYRIRNPAQQNEPAFAVNSFNISILGPHGRVLRRVSRGKIFEVGDRLGKRRFAKRAHVIDENREYLEGGVLIVHCMMWTPTTGTTQILNFNAVTTMLILTFTSELNIPMSPELHVNDWKYRYRLLRQEEPMMQGDLSFSDPTSRANLLISIWKEENYVRYSLFMEYKLFHVRLGNRFMIAEGEHLFLPWDNTVWRYTTDLTRQGMLYNGAERIREQVFSFDFRFNIHGQSNETLLEI